MAIRVGSQGLRYQPTNYAQLSARRSAAAASAGGASSASAYSANRRYALGKKRLQHDAEQAELDREFQENQANLDRDQEARTRLFTAQAQAIQNYEDRDSRLRLQGALGQFNLDREQLRGEYDIDREILEGIRRGELELPPAAAQQLMELDAASADLKNLDEGQIQEFNKRAKDRYRELLRTARPKRRSPAEEFNKGVSYVDQEGKAHDEPGPGRTPFRDGKPIFDTTDAEVAREKVRQQDLQDFQRNYLREYTKLRTATDEFGDLIHTEESAQEAAQTLAEELLREAQRARGLLKLPAPTQSPGQGPQPQQQGQLNQQLKQIQQQSSAQPSPAPAPGSASSFGAAIGQRKTSPAAAPQRKPVGRAANAQESVDLAIDAFIPKSRAEAKPGQMYIGSDGKPRWKSHETKKKPRRDRRTTSVMDAPAD